MRTRSIYVEALVALLNLAECCDTRAGVHGVRGGNEIGVGSGRIHPECTERRQVLTVEEAQGFQGDPQPACSPPE